MREMQKDVKKLKGIMVSLAFSCMVTLLFLLALSLLLWKAGLREGQLSIGITLTWLFSCFGGGWILGKYVERRKFLYGLLSGAVYFLLIFLISMVSRAGQEIEPLQVFLNFLICAGGGMAGGMLS